jgi:4-hydroxybenzoate polyprenyltransferase
MPSVYSCEVCRARICVTCAFTFPGDRRFCPACATAPRDALSPARARTVTSSLVLAGVGTAAIVGMPVLGALGGTAGPQGSTAIGLFMLYLGFGPALIGMIMAISSLQRGGANPPRVWAGIVWNGAIAGVFLLMMLMGLFLKGH